MACNVAILIKVFRSARFRQKFDSGRDDKNAIIANTNGDGGETAAAAAAEETRKSSKYREEKHIAVVLIVLSVAFATCQMLRVFPEIKEDVWCGKVDDCLLKSATDLLIRVTHLSVCLKSLLNFFIYYVNGKRFRKAWAAAFYCSQGGAAGAGSSGGVTHSSQGSGATGSTGWRFRNSILSKTLSLKLGRNKSTNHGSNEEVQRV